MAITVNKVTGPDEAVDTITLSTPISDISGSEITELHFRAPRLGDIKGLRLSEDSLMSVDTLVSLAVKLTGYPQRTLDLLGLEDAGKLIEVSASFLGRLAPGASA